MRSTLSKSDGNLETNLPYHSEGLLAIRCRESSIQADSQGVETRTLARDHQARGDCALRL